MDIHVNTSNTPAIRLEQNSSGGFTAQTWDVAGNEANFFVRDVTGGSRLPFRIRPGAPTSSIDVSASGEVGIGTASPDATLEADITQDGNTHVKATNPNSTGLSAQAGFFSQASTANAFLITHGAGRTATRYGVTLGSFAELLTTAGQGLLVGTGSLATPVIFGTNKL